MCDTHHMEIERRDSIDRTHYIATNYQHSSEDDQVFTICWTIRESLVNIRQHENEIDPP